MVRNNRAWRDLAHQGMVLAEERQYACGPCDNVWWRKVPTRKAVRLYIANVIKFANDFQQVGALSTPIFSTNIFFNLPQRYN